MNIIATAAHDAIGLIFLVLAGLAASWGYWLSCIGRHQPRPPLPESRDPKQLRRYAEVNSRFLS